MFKSGEPGLDDFIPFLVNCLLEGYLFTFTPKCLIVYFLKTFSSVTTEQSSQSGNKILIYYCYLIHSPQGKHLLSISSPSWGVSQVVPVVKNPPANARDIRDVSLIPGSGRSPGGGHGDPFQYSCLENPMVRGVW